MSIQRSVLTSCIMSSIGNRGARSSGVTGFPVPGCKIGGSGSGKSARILYQCLGISFSSRVNFVLSTIVLLWFLIYKMVFQCSSAPTGPPLQSDKHIDYLLLKLKSLPPLKGREAHFRGATLLSCSTYQNNYLYQLPSLAI
ncbi:hypothetical protein ES703_63650 [subsurface metagenome]